MTCNLFRSVVNSSIPFGVIHDYFLILVLAGRDVNHEALGSFKSPHTTGVLSHTISFNTIFFKIPIIIIGYNLIVKY